MWRNRNIAYKNLKSATFCLPLSFFCLCYFLDRIQKSCLFSVRPHECAIRANLQSAFLWSVLQHVLHLAPPFTSTPARLFDTTWPYPESISSAHRGQSCEFTPGGGILSKR